tara:strand:- start:819 stop:974 length:156 start_codon:yes stop_codon:yes gene_type:complete
LYITIKIPFIDPKTKKAKVIIKNIGDVSAGAKFGGLVINLKNLKNRVNDDF